MNELLERFLPLDWKSVPQFIKTYNHSRTVANAAKTISAKIHGLDSNKAYIYGLMHDVGKFHLTKQDSYKHPRFGYELLKDDFYDIAEICISHAFPDFDSFDYILSYCNNDKIEADKISGILKNIVKTDYIDLIQLCDKVSGHNSYMMIESKFDWYLKTYNIQLDDISKDYLKSLQAIKSKFDNLLKNEVYDMLRITPIVK